MRLLPRSLWILKIAAEVRDVGWPMVEATHFEEVTEWELAALRLGVIECMAFFAWQRQEAERKAMEASEGVGASSCNY